jgi:iron complex outermembrane receptor protein
VTPLGVAIALALAVPAFAQEAVEATDLDTVIVTGTRATDRTELPDCRQLGPGARYYLCH